MIFKRSQAQNKRLSDVMASFEKMVEDEKADQAKLGSSKGESSITTNTPKVAKDDAPTIHKSSFCAPPNPSSSSSAAQPHNLKSNASSDKSSSEDESIMKEYQAIKKTKAELATQVPPANGQPLVKTKWRAVDN